MIPPISSYSYSWQIALAGLLFALLFPSVSFLINRRWCRVGLVLVFREIMLSAALVFVLAIICEATVNPIYTMMFGDKLWVYKLFPLHDGNISALAIVVWSSYGVHLYFLNQMLDSRIIAGAHRNIIKAAVIGIEAPLLWEVLGNGFFLLTVGDFYAYYLPGELAHFTSPQVIPIYMLCVYIGLYVHEHLRKRSADWRLTAGLFSAGIAFLGMG